MVSGLAKLLDLITGAWELLKPYAAVYAWEKGALTRWGRYHRTLEPGYHFKWPIAEKVHKVQTAISTMRGATQTIGKRTVRWTVKFQVVDVLAFSVAIFVEVNFLRDVVAGQIAEHLQGLVTWPNMMEQLREETAEGGFRILKMRLIDDTTEAMALRLLTSSVE